MIPSRPNPVFRSIASIGSLLSSRRRGNKRAGRNSRGFTLTEILVVSVIIAILSAVAVPVYNGYVQQQRMDAVKNLASAAAVAANVIYRRTGALPVCEQPSGECAAALNLLLPEAGRYSVTLPADNPRHVKVVDNLHPEAYYVAPF